MISRYFKQTTQEEYDEVKKVGERLALLGLEMGVGGNLSIRISSGSGILTTVSGAGLQGFSEENLVEVEFNGNPVHGGLKPSKDVSIHLGIYNACPEVKAIVHTHSPFATSISMGEGKIPLLTVVSIKLKSLPILETKGMDRIEQGRFIGKFIGKHGLPGVILKSHGVIATARTIAEAEKTAELIESTAKIAIIARAYSGK
jgi:L-fuculose-phosphate aldolase